MSSYAQNRFSPDYFAGLGIPDPTQTGQEIKPYAYIYNPPNGVLNANQQIANDTVAIQTDADFYMFAWYISLFTGDFQIQLTDSTGYQLQSGFLNSAAISQQSSDPTIFDPAHFFPAGSKILINIEDLSGDSNPLQIVFPGIKVYKMVPQMQRR